MNDRTASVATATADGPPEGRVLELLGLFGAPDACAAELLCDRHPAEAVAFTVVEADLSATDLTYGELRRDSAGSRPHSPTWGSGPATRSPP